MARSLDTHVAKLRKRSRILLAQLEENSWKVNQELTKLFLLTSSSNENSSQQPIHPLKISEFWQLRNDSSGVGGALCPDYFSFNPPCASSLPKMTMQKRLLLSKKKEDSAQFRKPVKECYCNRATRKMQFRSTRTKVKAVPCNHCRSLVDLRPMAWVESNDQPSKTTPVSCETIRRIQNINYCPQSEFLQNKVSSTHDLLDERSLKIPSKHNSRFLSRYPSGAGDRVQNESKSQYSRNLPVEFYNEPRFYKSAEISNKSSCSKNIDCPANKLMFDELNCHKFPITSQKPSKESIGRRTILSKKVSCVSKDEQSRKTKSNNCVFGGNIRSSLPRSSNINQDIAYYSEDYNEEDEVLPKYTEETTGFPRQRCKATKTRGTGENEIVNLHKFREQNYFDTHGSMQTLISSRSSGSLERYLLNERLFPQPAGKIHRGDLMVTMPSCATKQRKRIHYFPRYVVRQEKKNNETTGGYKKHSCPLIGHAIDVGNLKINHPANSLALRFQKGVPP